MWSFNVRTFPLVVALLAVLLPQFGCEEQFSAKGPYRERMAVYAILTTRSDTQYVRVYSTYNPPGYDPLANTSDNQITDATVTLAKSDSVFSFRDTSVTRTNKSRYTSDINMYYSYPLRLKRGTSYHLSVVSPSVGTVTSTVTVIPTGVVSVVNSGEFQQPAIDGKINALVFLGQNAQGYELRLYLEYSALINGLVEIRRVEVPASFQISSDSLHFVEAAYPGIIYRGQSIYMQRDGSETASFPSLGYITTVRQLRSQYPDSLKLRKAVFVLSQLDQNLYGYYNVANGFPDSFTLRVDEPDYTNIDGGVGILGVLTEDTYTVTIPNNTKIP